VTALARLRWVRAVLVVGGVYLVAGILFAALAKSASSHQMVVAWRLAAWVISASALAVWPVITALPAFLVALASAAVLARARRSV
jgi:hypothetical protein